MKTFAILAIAAAALASQASATHFQYGTIRWSELAEEDQPEDKSTFSVLVTFELAISYAWLKGKSYATPQVGKILDLGPQGSSSHDGFEIEVNSLEGPLQDFDNFMVTVSSQKEDIVMGYLDFTVTYPKSGIHTIFWTDCCRTLDIGNNSFLDWLLEVQVKHGEHGARSPVASWLPTLQVHDEGVQYIQLDALAPAPDADLVWAMAEGERMGWSLDKGSNTNLHELSGDPETVTIDPDTGVLAIDTEWFRGRPAVDGLWTVQVLVYGSKSPQIAIPIDFTIKILPQPNLCVDQCSNYISTCDIGSDQCINCGPLQSGDAYETCQQNSPPEVDAPEYIIAWTDQRLEQRIDFAANTIHETHHTLTMVTSNLPRNTQFEFTEREADAQSLNPTAPQGFGTFIIPEEFNDKINLVPRIVCFQAYDDWTLGPVSCSRIVVWHTPAPPDWECHKKKHSDCNDDKTCEWDHPWRVCRGVYEMEDMVHDYNAGVELHRYADDPCMYLNDKQCKETSHCDYHGRNTKDMTRHNTPFYKKCSFVGVHQRHSSTGEDKSWNARTVSHKYGMHNLPEDMVCGEAFTKEDCQNLNEADSRHNLAKVSIDERKCIWEECFYLGVGHPFCRPFKQVPLEATEDHPADENRCEAAVF